MLEKVFNYSIKHAYSKEGGVAHATTHVYADGVLLSNLIKVEIKVDTVDFAINLVGVDGVYPKSKYLELNLNFLSGFSVVGTYPDICVFFDGKKVNYIQAFTYTMDLIKESRLPLIHFAVL